MNAMTNFPPELVETPLLKVLTGSNTGTSIGYRVGGACAGPSLVIAAHNPVSGIIYDRLISLPTLGRIRGTLTLVCLNALESEGMCASFASIADPKPDEIFILPYHIATEFHEKAANEGYWSILRKCHQLGMISGRGLPYAIK